MRLAIKKKKLFGVAIVTIIHLMALIVYEIQLVVTNAYVGFLPHQFGLLYLLRILVGIVAISFVIPEDYVIPSDYLSFIYSVFVLAPFVFFGDENQGFVVFLSGVLLMSVPLVFIRKMAYIRIDIVKIGLYSERWMIMILGFIVVLSLAAMYVNAPIASGFSLNDSYTRRMEGRDIFLARSPIAYAISATANGIGPFMAFVAGYKRRRLMFLVVLLIPFVLYYVLGLKAPVAYVCLSFVYGILVFRRQLGKLPTYIFLIILFMFAVFIVEQLLFGYSMSGEYVFRRFFVVNGRNMQKYMEMIFGSYGWSVLQGVRFEKGAAYYVGKLFYTEDSNVNTNALLFSFASGGVVLYAFIVFLVGIYYALIDCYYRKYKDPFFLFLGLFYALLITEQAATTALATSGYALLFLALVMKSGKKTSRTIVSLN